MPSESHMIVYSWAEIAKYSPFRHKKSQADLVRKRFGKEMQRLNVVRKSRKPGSYSPRLVMWGIVWKIEKYFELKAKRRELFIDGEMVTSCPPLSSQDIVDEVYIK